MRHSRIADIKATFYENADPKNQKVGVDQRRYLSQLGLQVIDELERLYRIIRKSADSAMCELTESEVFDREEENHKDQCEELGGPYVF